MMRKKMRKFLKKGSGEVIGFVCMAPFMLVLLTVIMAAAQISCVNQALEAAAYSSARVAVVTDDKDAAAENALSIAESIVYGSAGKIDEDSVTVDIEIIKAGGTKDEWVKGNLCKVTVSADVRTVLPFMSGTKSRDITLMIERPAPATIDIVGPTT